MMQNSSIVNNHTARKEAVIRSLTYADMQNLRSLVLKEAEYINRVIVMYEKGGSSAKLERKRGVMLLGLAEKLEGLINAQ